MNIKKYTVYEFLNKVKSEPFKWINYCEIIILQSGLIIIANPSHQEAILKYIKDKYHYESRQSVIDSIPKLCMPLEWFIDKHNLVAFYYQGYIESSKGLNRFQKHTIQILKDNNLLCDDPFVRVSNEYKNYLYRKDIGLEE